NVNGSFPTIFSGAQNTTWFCLMLPLIEQSALGNSFNYTLGSEGPNSPLPLGFFANSTIAQTKMSVFQCPSDRSLKFQINPGYAGGALSGVMLTKGNYGVSWGNTNWGAQFDTGTGGLGAQYMPSAFGHNGAITMASITDGTSNTVITGEVLQGEQFD